MKKTVLLSLFIICWVAPCLSQNYEQIINKSYKERVEDLGILYGNLLDLKDSTAVIKEVEKIEHLSREKGDHELLLEMQLFRAYHHSTIIKDGNFAPAITRLLRVAKEAEEKNVKHIQIRAYRIVAQRYWDHIKNYELAFEHYVLLEKELEKVSPDEYPDMAVDLLRVGLAYYFFQDYMRANSYFEKVIALPETNFNTLAISSAKHTLGLYYQKIKDYDTADDYFRQVLNAPFQKSIELWEGIAKGGLGTNLYNRGNYLEAIPLLEFNYKKAEQVNDYGMAGVAMTLLADIYLKQGKLALSKAYLDRAKAYIIQAGEPEKLQKLYPVISKWYSATHQKDSSELYLDSAIIALNQYNETFSALKMLRVEQKSNMQERALELAQFGLEKQKSISQRNILIGITLLVLLGTLSYYLSQKKKQKIKDLQIQISTKELEAAQKELKTALTQIHKTTRALSEKNKLIEQLQGDSGKEQESVVQQLQQSMILTGDDWIEFQSLFERAYPSFIDQLKCISPKLTQAEIRMLLLVKLKFSVKETSHILGISYDSARVSWYRTVKKFDQPSNISPDEFLHKILNQYKTQFA